MTCKHCQQPVYSLELCSAHYQRKRRAERQPEPHTYFMSYSEIAAELGISRQAVQQIEQRALAKLRASGALDDWKDHLPADTGGTRDNTSSAEWGVHRPSGSLVLGLPPG